MWGNIITILFVSGYPCISESVVYRLQRTERSFQHSLSHCVWMFDGLAEIYNAKQQQYLSLIAGGKEVWIGVSRCQQNWCYTGSGRMVSYTNWAKGEPNNYYSFIFGEENCVLMLSSREWNDENCSDKNYSVCQQLQCKATTCNRRGRCIELTDGFRCTCDQGFYGNNCENEQCKATTCNRRGTCTEMTGGLRCICDQGFYGNNCENEQCKATSCNRRGTCIELTGGFRCICDQGFYGNNCENVRSCPVITKPNHSTVNCEGLHGKNHFQSVSTFTCDRGFILNGNISATCQASGSWTTYNTICQEQCKATSCNRRGTCIELTGGFRCICDQGFYGNNCENVRSCPVITKPNHSTVNCEGLHGKNHFQSVCTFTCDRGFILNGNISATCQASGSWTTYNTICQEQCKAASCNRRGTCIELTGGFRCICDQGFYGNNCENVRSCPVITKPNHSTVNCEGLHGKNHFQSVCTVTCDRGFILNGNISATCQASGSWTTYNTICQAITCTLLKKPEYSSVNCSGPYGEKHYNTSCYFSCDDGYTLEGDHKTVCKESGNWNSYDVQCTVNHLKLILIIVSMGAVAVALLVLSVICWWKRRNRQEQNNTNDDLPMQLKNSTYASHDIYVLPTCLDNETPQDEMYVNNLSTVQDMYKNLE